MVPCPIDLYHFSTLSFQKYHFGTLFFKLLPTLVPNLKFPSNFNGGGPKRQNSQLFITNLRFSHVHSFTNPHSSLFAIILCSRFITVKIMKSSHSTSIHEIEPHSTFKIETHSWIEPHSTSPFQFQNPLILAIHLINSCRDSDEPDSSSSKNPISDAVNLKPSNPWRRRTSAAVLFLNYELGLPTRRFVCAFGISRRWWANWGFRV